MARSPTPAARAPAPAEMPPCPQLTRACTADAFAHEYACWWYWMRCAEAMPSLFSNRRNWKLWNPEDVPNLSLERSVCQRNCNTAAPKRHELERRHCLQHGHLLDEQLRDGELALATTRLAFWISVTRRSRDTTVCICVSAMRCAGHVCAMPAPRAPAAGRCRRRSAPRTGSA